MNQQQLLLAWATQSEPTGRSGNLRFVGKGLYSYAQPIARLYFAPGRVALFQAYPRSVTTTRHISAARVAALKAGFQHIVVPDLTPDHERNLQFFAGRLADELQRSIRAKRETFRFTTTAYQYDCYCEHFHRRWFSFRE